MRYIAAVAFFVVVLASCKKDDFNTVPQITYKSIENNFVDGTAVSGSTSDAAHANVVFEITDAEGDFGITSKDTAFIYVKSLLTNDVDSMVFPDLSTVSKKNFKFNATASLEKVTKCKSLPSNAVHTDTVYYEIYVKDYKKNKSNVIKTGDPVYFKCR